MCLCGGVKCCGISLLSAQPQCACLTIRIHANVLMKVLKANILMDAHGGKWRYSQLIYQSEAFMTSCALSFDKYFFRIWKFFFSIKKRNLKENSGKFFQCQTQREAYKIEYCQKNIDILEVLLLTRASCMCSSKVSILKNNAREKISLEIVAAFIIVVMRGEKESHIISICMEYHVIRMREWGFSRWRIYCSTFNISIMELLNLVWC